MKYIFGGILLIISINLFAGSFTVNTTADSGAGSLRDAIANAVSGDTVDFSITGTIYLTSGELTWSKDLTIIGPGADQLAISGNLTSRVIYITGGTSRLSGLTIKEGKLAMGFGAGIRTDWTATVTLYECSITDCQNTASFGGGILAGGTMLIDHCHIANNQANGGGGLSVNMSQTVTVTNTTFYNNNGGTGDGGAIRGFSGNVDLMNCTISQNTASRGGGVALIDGGTIDAVNLTICGNNASNGNNIYIQGDAFLSVNAELSMKNCIIDNTFPGNNYATGTNVVFISYGFNISNDASMSTGLTGEGDMSNTDPQLTPLADNGGFAYTHGLLATSPAINAGDATGTLPYDQRGISRVGVTDIGAFEDDGGALPVELIGFNVYGYSNKNNKLIWQTATEEQSEVFVVQRSYNGTDFSDIDNVYAAGFSTNKQIYTIHDASFNSGYGIVYYRLKMVDSDGSFTYSKIVSVKFENEVLVFPNPVNVNGGFAIEGIDASNYTLALYDQSGSKVFESKGLSYIKTDIPAGCYLLVLANANERITKKLVVR